MQYIIIIILSLSPLFLFAQTQSNCFVIDGSDICLSLTRQGTRYDLGATLAWRSIPLHCHIRTPEWNTIIDFLRACNDSFTHEGSVNGVFTIYATANNQIFTFTYDLVNNRWTYLGRNSTEWLPQATQRTPFSSFWSTSWSPTLWPVTSRAARLNLDVSPLSPRRNERMTMTIRATTSSRQTIPTYENRLALAVSYRTSANGARIVDRSQQFYTLHGITNSFRIERNDFGTKQLINAISFSQAWDYRISLTDGNVRNDYLIRVQP